MYIPLILALYRAVCSLMCTQVAAMGPATVILDFPVFLFFFINVATTNLIATRVAQLPQPVQPIPHLCTAPHPYVPLPPTLTAWGFSPCP